MLFAGHPGLFPLRRMDFRVVPDQGVRRRSPAAPRRADHRVAHLLRASAGDTQTSRQCAPFSAQLRLRTLSRSLATPTWSACHLAVTRGQRLSVTRNAVDEPVLCQAGWCCGRGLPPADGCRPIPGDPARMATTTSSWPIAGRPVRPRRRCRTGRPGRSGRRCAVGIGSAEPATRCRGRGHRLRRRC